MFWYEDKISKEKFDNENLSYIGFFMDFELGLVLIKSTLLFEPKLID